MKIYEAGIIDKERYETYGQRMSYGVFSSLELAMKAIPKRELDEDGECFYSWGLFYVEEKELDTNNSCFVYKEEPEHSLFREYKEAVL